MDRRILKHASFIVAIAALSVSRAFAESPLYVGVIENIQDIWDSGDQNEYVRLAFVKKGDTWLPMGSQPSDTEELVTAPTSFPDKVDWVVVYDGRKLGEIASKNLSPYQNYGQFGIQLITSPDAAIPKVATDAGEFTYISGANHARTRPLLVVSAPNYHDPEGWKRTSLTDVELKAAIVEFRKKVSLQEHCEAQDEETPQMHPYPDDQIVQIKAYRSRSGELLFGERLDNAKSGCDDYDDENDFDYWFVRTKDGGIHFLGSEMIPIDAADLDNDGSSEWVFHTSRGEDDEGYVLFYSDFSKAASFQWFYH